ncbi:hypothetical protein BD410DRAFT_684934, partial [Rickenella mellea]
MVRRIANQVHQQAARLLRANYLQKEPSWYQAVLEYPPIPLPPRATSSRSTYDLPPPRKPQSRHFKPAKLRTLPVFYIEDEVRRQFFRDHPFEAFRERSLVETGAIEPEHPIQGHAWTRLGQHGKNPEPEDAVRFAVNLHRYHDVSLARAYATAVMQFRSLRSEHHIATKVAAAEAEAYGAEFGKTETEKSFDREGEFLKTWDNVGDARRSSDAARKRWKAIIDTTGWEGSWTKGEEYVRLWKEGIRPNYA